MTRAAFLSFLLLGACFLRAKPGEIPEPRPDPIPVRVKNENFLDMNVYAVVSGVQRRLGTVAGNSTANYTIPWSFVNGQGLQMLAVPIGGRGSAASGSLNPGYGQMIDFLIASQLRQSVATVHEP